jgi:hypothetical protein
MNLQIDGRNVDVASEWASEINTRGGVGKEREAYLPRRRCRR